MSKKIETQMEITIKCVHCNKKYEIFGIDPEAYQQWINGEGFIQDLLPNLLPWEREMMISATCDNCWRGMFEEAETEDYLEEETMD